MRGCIIHNLNRKSFEGWREPTFNLSYKKHIYREGIFLLHHNAWKRFKSLQLKNNSNEYLELMYET